MSYTIAQGLQDFQNSFAQGQQSIYTATNQPNPFAPIKVAPTKKPDAPTNAPTEAPPPKDITTDNTKTENDKDKDQNDKDKYKWYWIAGAVAVVIIIGVVIYTTTTKKRKP